MVTRSSRQFDLAALAEVETATVRQRDALDIEGTGHARLPDVTSGVGSGSAPLAQAAALARASSGRLARAGTVLLHLQHDFGNRHVQQALDYARRASGPAPVVQPGLVLGPAGDRYEQEADRVARGVVGHAAQWTEAGGAEAGRAPRTSAMQPAHGADAGAVDPQVQQAVRGARVGRPLPGDVRAVMEPALGADLRGVRLHTDAQADQLSRVLGARAFTTGQEVFFRHGEYTPGDTVGHRLLAHELTHVAQQTATALHAGGARPARKAAVPPPAGAGVIQRVVIDGHDTETRHGLRRLMWQARKMTQLEEIDAMRAKIPLGESGAPGEGELLRALALRRDRIEAPPPQREHMEALRQEYAEAFARHQERTELRNPSLLAHFAARLKHRGAGEQPRSVAEHLRQRLGDVEREKRPAVRARRQRGDTVRIEAVAYADYQRLLAAAEQADWDPLTRKDRKDREKLAAATPTWSAEAKYRQKKFSGSALYEQAKIIRTTAEDPPSHVDLRDYKLRFASAWETITKQVEAEVLETVGLPKVHILGSGNEELGSRAAFYDEKTQTIKIHWEKVTAGQLQHEFGHHIEEQGPVEIWYGLASLLKAISGDRPLEGPEQGSSREVTYNPSQDVQGRLPKVPYSLSYYPDAGTELLSLAMEDFSDREGVLADLKEYVNWLDDAESPYLPRYVALLLHAFRPREMRELGLAYPALL